eukprot:114745-Heterocapsa_arctica.AAC.1
MAYYLATRPSERQILGRFGTVRMTRTEALNIVKTKKLPFNFLAVVEVRQITWYGTEILSGMWQRSLRKVFRSDQEAVGRQERNERRTIEQHY